MDNYYFYTRTKNNICPICLLLFLKRYNWNVNTHLELSRIYFLQFSVYDIFFDWRTQSASHWLRFKVSLVMVQTTLFMNFSSKKKNPYCDCILRLLMIFLKIHEGITIINAAVKIFFIIHAFHCRMYNSQSESVSRWSFKNELFGGNCFEVK